MIIYKLDRVAPLITDTSRPRFVQKKNIVIFDLWHMIHDMWQVGGGEPSLEISALLLLSIGSEGVLKIFSQMTTELVN